MADQSPVARNWAELHWPSPYVIVRDLATAHTLAPNATGEPHEDRNAWYWRTTSGSIIAVTKRPGSVHETSHPFGTLRDAAADFATYWPAGVLAEDIESREWMALLAARTASVVFNGQAAPARNQPRATQPPPTRRV